MDEIIQVNQLTRKFGSRMAVDQISFRVKRGEIFGFLGPNGAGKTTTIRILTGQLLPASGSLSVCGVDPSHEPKKLATHIGLSQKFRTYISISPLSKT
jgi:ABC-2 type transport system ATP-binding protein